MFELIGGAEPKAAAAQGGFQAPTAVELHDRVAAGIEFARMLYQAEREQSSPSETEEALQEAPERHGTGGEVTVAQSEGREEAPVEDHEEAPGEEETTATPRVWVTPTTWRTPRR